MKCDRAGYLTPNPFPSGKGNRKGFVGSVRPIPLTPFPMRKGGTEGIGVFTLRPGAGVTPAQGGAEPTVGSAFDKVIYPSPFAGLSISLRLR